MRILHIVHYFLPDHVAGVEVYTNHLTRRQAEKHDVALLYTEVDHGAPDHSLRRGWHGRVQTFEVVNNHRFRSFGETYSNPAIDRRITEVLDEFAPEVVHVQHLINLSTGAIEELKRRRIPIVMTLHDHWLACANGGQRFHRELGRCDRLDADRCGACTAPMHAGRRGPIGWLRRRLEQVQAPIDAESLALTELRPEEIVTPNPDFVRLENFELAASAPAAWIAHPPSRLGFRVESETGGALACHVAMHPATYDQEGGGVCFRIFVNGTLGAEKTLDAKRALKDRGPHRLRVELPPGESWIELDTTSVPSDRPDHCTAGWIAPRIVSSGGVMRPVGDAVPSESSRMRRLSGRILSTRQTQRVADRWQVMRRIGGEIDCFLAPSRYLGDAMVEFGLPRNRVRYCDYGFVTEAFRRREDLPRFARRFAFVGSLVQHKGTHVLLDAFEKLPADARLDVCGSPEYDPAYYASLVARTHHPGVHFRGGLSPERIPAFLGEIDVQIVPSIWNENSPLTIHEAFMTGVPVVASRMGGHVELLEPGGGLLYDPDDADQLAEVLHRLYDEPDLARRLGASCPPVKPMDEHCVELMEIYEKLLDTVNRGGGA